MLILSNPEIPLMMIYSSQKKEEYFLTLTAMSFVMSKK